MARVLTIVVLATILTSTTASAQCAWVFWSYMMRYDRPDGPAYNSYWVVEDTFPTYDDCQRSLAKKRQDPGGFDFGGKPAIRRDLGEGQSLVALFYCRPDTVDPRK